LSLISPAIFTPPHGGGERLFRGTSQRAAGSLAASTAAPANWQTPRLIATEDCQMSLMSRLRPWLCAAMLLPAGPALAQYSLTHDGFDDNDGNQCMTDHMLRTFVTGKGYTQVKLNVGNGSGRQVKATKGSRIYLLYVDTCSRSIVSSKALGTN
jgi:hypothetical protein